MPRPRNRPRLLTPATPRLSHSATENPLYRLAFGDAAESEAADRDCDRAQTTLKRARRKLFNKIIIRKFGEKDELLSLLWRQAGYQKEGNRREPRWERCINVKSGDEDEEGDEEGEPESPVYRGLRDLEPYPSYHPRGVPRAETRDLDDDEYDFDDEPVQRHTGSRLKFRVNLGGRESDDEDVVETIHYGPSTESDGYLPDSESGEDEEGDADGDDRWYQWDEDIDPSLGESPEADSEPYDSWDLDLDELDAIDLIAGEEEGSGSFV
jgi:hypothetical protein